MEGIAGLRISSDVEQKVPQIVMYLYTIKYDVWLIRTLILPCLDQNMCENMLRYSRVEIETRFFCLLVTGKTIMWICPVLDDDSPFPMYGLRAFHTSVLDFQN